MNFNISDIPFSRRGSYFAVSYLAKFKAVFIRDVHGGDESPSELFELNLAETDGSDILSPTFQAKYKVEATETLFKISLKENPAAYLALILPTDNQLRLEVVGLKLSLKAHKVRYDSLNHIGEKKYEYISYKKETKYQISLLGNHSSVIAPWYRVGNPAIDIQLDGSKEKQEISFINYQVVPPVAEEESPSFELAHNQIAQDYQAWVATSLEVPANYHKGSELANYIIWSSIVRPEGQLTRESVYMSKNWMQNIWSWDNCFNAMGIGRAHPELAFEQFQIFIDHQDPSGVYPDFINNQYVSYNCCKPPIHAWAYEQLRQEHTYFSQEPQLRIIYDSLVKSTNFWLTHRMSDLGLPYYTHGNDSGWDNASVFHHGLPVTSPDLTAYLIQQLDILTQWAASLGETSAVKKWQSLANDLTNLLLSHLHDGEHFFARSSRTGERIEEENSLLLCLPLVISYRLPKEVTAKLVKRIIERHEGKYGLSTEASVSPHYQVDGYWLGPIWAPETYIFFDAFRRNDDHEIAKRLAEKYCYLATKNGMAENYNPETGEGNDDLSFTWTSSVFLLLGNYLKESNG